MIRTLRRRHRRMIWTLAIIVPVLFVAALLARPTPPIADGLALEATPAYPTEVNAWDDLWPSVPITTRLLADRMPAEQLAVELTPTEALLRPDVLVYWVPGEVQEAALPETSYLLGALQGTEPQVWPLPEEARYVSGTLLLYSLPHDEVIAHTSLPSSE